MGDQTLPYNATYSHLPLLIRVCVSTLLKFKFITITCYAPCELKFAIYWIEDFMLGVG
jgi:hypothetical protein